MALKPTIYKAKISLAHIEANHYDDLDLTLALHPSESVARMMARVLAFCMNAADDPAFTRGLSSAEEPDIWSRTLDDRISLWIDVGAPAADRIKKAARIAQTVKVYAFHLKAASWWDKAKEKFQDLNVSVFQFDWQGIQDLAGLVERTMVLEVTVSEGVIYVSCDAGRCEIPWTQLQ